MTEQETNYNKVITGTGNIRVEVTDDCVTFFNTSAQQSDILIPIKQWDAIKKQVDQAISFNAELNKKG